MKTLNSLFVLIIALSSLMATAQKADSVIVIYDNQKTVIPVPAFGSQTTIKMADSIQIIEIGVLRKRAGENFSGTVYSKDQLMQDNKSEKGRKQVKWFSQIEAAYTTEFTEMSENFYSTYETMDGITINWIENYDFGNTIGYQLRILLREKENMLNNKISFNSGLKIGYGRLSGSGYYHSSEYDSTGIMISNNSFFLDFRKNNFQLAYEFGFGYHFKAFKIPSKITLGNGFTYSISGSKDKNNIDRNSSYITSYASILHPFIGAELGRFGILISLDWKISDTAPGLLLNSFEYHNFNKRNRTLTTGLTFRLF